MCDLIITSRAAGAGQQSPAGADAFKRRLEALFGCDAACGVTYVEAVAEGEPRVWTAAEYQALSKEQRPNDTCCMLPNGGSALVCTEYARLVAQRLPGRVEIFGFFCEDNPTSRIARKSLAEGHDFAIVDSRWLVDPWIKLLEGEVEQAVFDLHDAIDMALVSDIYGSRGTWEPNPVATALKHCLPVEPFTDAELA